MVLARYWHIEMAPVLLKRWSPLFDPNHEQIGVGPLWVRLPGLPLQYWNEEVFMCIRNALGTYLDHDRSYVESRSRTLARILVHLDTRDGLEEKITLHWGRYARVQILDYEGVPFKCRRCHRVGHLFKECPLNKKQEGPATSTTPSRPISPAAHCTPASSAPSGSPALPPGSTQGASQPPITRARAASTSTSAPGISLFPPLSNCTSGFFNLSPSLSVAHCTMPSSPVIAPSIPSPRMIASPHTSPSSSGGTSHKYNLRPRPHPYGSHIKIVGLGTTSPSLVQLSAQGRKSHLTKAIQKAGAEAASGRQSTIDEVLRAMHTPGNLPP